MNEIRFGLVLVALDGSAFAERALPIACSIVRQAGNAGQVKLVHVHDRGAFAANAPAVDSTWENERAGEMGLELTKTAARWAAETNLNVTAVVLRGRAAESISAYAIEHCADLVVMTTHGRSGLKRALVGSVTEEVLRTARTPVLVVPASE